MRHIEVPPYAPILMESTRAIGYSLESAVADVIDNSIAAFASNIWIDFFPVGDEYISILDDGIGMDKNEITNAMQYGSKSPKEERSNNDLGRFGLGLKTASLSQGKKLTVLSKKNGCFEGRRWDLDYVSQSGKWSLGILDNNEMKQIPQYNRLNELQSGTLVIWENLDRLKNGELDFEASLGRKMDDVKSHLSMVFHRYLSGEKGIKKILLTVNNVTLSPADPFLIGKSEMAMDKEIFLIRKEKIEVQPYILPHTSKLTKDELDSLGGKDGFKKQQGFYVYRNKRLLVWGTWFRMLRQGETSKLVRIMVDVPNKLDDLWTLDIKKSVAKPPEELRRNLKVIVEKLADKSKRTWTFRGKKENDDNILHMWNRLRTRNGGYIYQINCEYPLIVDLVKEQPQIKNQLYTLFAQIESGLPLNSLYLDMVHDNKVENDTEFNEIDIIETVRQILNGVPIEEHTKMIDKLLVSDPFNSYAKEIIEAFKEGKDDR